jgi:membrane protein YdbS with pleckstrin-like domain
MSQTQVAQLQPPAQTSDQNGSHQMSLHTVLTATLCGLVLLLITAGAVYLCWQHPTATGPITAGAAVAAACVAGIGVLAGLVRRRT